MSAKSKHDWMCDALVGWTPEEDAPSSSPEAEITRRIACRRLELERLFNDVTAIRKRIKNMLKDPY